MKLADLKDKIVQILWLDAWYSGNVWGLQNLINKPDLILHTYGQIIYVDESKIILAGEWESKENEYKHVHCIPLVLVKDILVYEYSGRVEEWKEIGNVPSKTT